MDIFACGLAPRSVHQFDIRVALRSLNGQVTRQLPTWCEPLAGPRDLLATL
jgi:hypothetical protein